MESPGRLHQQPSRHHKAQQSHAQERAQWQKHAQVMQNNMQTLVHQNQQLAHYVQQMQRNAESPVSNTADDHEPKPPGFFNIHPVCRGPASTTTDVYGGSQLNTTFPFSQILDANSQQWQTFGLGNESVRINLLQSGTGTSSSQPVLAQFISVQHYQQQQGDPQSSSTQTSGEPESIIPVL